MQINRALQSFLIESTNKSCLLFKRYTDIAKLNNPMFLITKPIFCVFVLKHSLQVPLKFDWNSQEDLLKLWMATRD